MTIPALIWDLSRNGGTSLRTQVPPQEGHPTEGRVPPMRDKSPYRFLPPSPSLPVSPFARDASSSWNHSPAGNHEPSKTLMWTMDWMGLSAVRPATTSLHIRPKDYQQPPGETPGLPGRQKALGPAKGSLTRELGRLVRSWLSCQAERWSPRRTPGETPGLPGKDRASTGSPEVSSGLDRFSSGSSPNPSFSVFSVRSAVNPQADEQEPNHRVLRGLRESLDFNGVFRTAAARQ